MKPQDSKAASVLFGVELETAIPAASGITVGFYHRGTPVTGGLDSRGAILAASGQATKPTANKKKSNHAQNAPRKHSGPVFVPA